MATRRFLVKEVHTSNPISQVSPDDFTVEPAGEVDPQEVLLDPKYSLYCVDPERQEAIFVESADPDAVDRAVFYYQGQRKDAVAIVAMPLELFHNIAEEIPEPAKGLIFVHSVGRCGSTLLSKVLDAIPAVHSISEPDDLTQVCGLWVNGKCSDEWTRRYLVSSTRWRGKARSRGLPDYLAIKTRSEVLALAEMFGTCFPTAKHLFLYRDAISWMATIFRGWPIDRDVYDSAKNRQMEEGWARTLPLVRTSRRDDAPMNPIQVRILGWIACMEGFLHLQEMHVPTCAARFEDLSANPVSIVEQILAFCGIEDVEWGPIHEVLSRDSQAGTIYDQKERRKLNNELTEALIQDIRDLLASRPRLRKPDFVAPRTVFPTSP